MINLNEHLQSLSPSSLTTLQKGGLLKSDDSETTLFPNKTLEIHFKNGDFYRVEEGGVRTMKIEGGGQIKIKGETYEFQHRDTNLRIEKDGRVKMEEGGEETEVDDEGQCWTKMKDGSKVRRRPGRIINLIFKIFFKMEQTK